MDGSNNQERLPEKPAAVRPSAPYHMQRKAAHAAFPPSAFEIHKDLTLAVVMKEPARLI